MILDLILDPNPILKRLSYEVPEKDIKTPATRELINNMIDTMRHHNGIGISAPQVGKNLQIIVVDTGDYQAYIKPRCPIIMINPKVMYADKHFMDSMDEGCLSFPGELRKVKRSHKIIVHYKDENNEHKIDLFTGITAVCIQHEVDHLAGITMDDRSKEQGGSNV